MDGDALEAAFWGRAKKRASGDKNKRNEAVLDCVRFVKWVTSSSLGVSGPDAELVFGKCTPGGERHLTYKHFLHRAVPSLAHRTGHTVPEVADILAVTIPPANPGPKTDRPRLVNMTGPLSKSGRQVLPQVPEELMEDLRAAFVAFASCGSAGQRLELMDSTTFSRMCQDCSILSRAFTRSEVDLIFRKTKTAGERKINFEQFITKAVPLVALGRGAEIRKVCKFLAKGRPVARGTKANVSGGISTELRGGHHGGVQAVQPAPLPAVPKEHHGAIRSVFQEFCAFGCHGRPPATAMDVVKFAKLMRDSGLVARQSDGRADMAFAESCERGARRISAATFLGLTLPLVSAKLQMSISEVAQRVAGARPSTTGTAVETGGVFEKLTDQRRYTGMYAALAGVDVNGSRRLETLFHRTVLPDVPADLECHLREPIKEAMRQFAGSAHPEADLGLEEDRFFCMVRDARLLGPGLDENDATEVFRLAKEDFLPVLDYLGLVQKAVPLMAAARGESDVYRVASRLSQAQPVSASEHLRRASRKFTSCARLFGSPQQSASEPSSSPSGRSLASGGPLPSLRSTPGRASRGPYRPRGQQFSLSRPGTSSIPRPGSSQSAASGRPFTSQSGAPSSLGSSGLWGSELLGGGDGYGSLPGCSCPAELGSLGGARAAYTSLQGTRRKPPACSPTRRFLDHRPEWDDHVLR